jgi:asparagine N-glycosylation enzyme membrane subunit Stt3
VAGGFAPPARSVLETLCALVIPAIGALNVLLVYWVARRFFGRPAALLAGVLLSIFKAHASIS